MENSISKKLTLTIAVAAILSLAGCGGGGGEGSTAVGGSQSLPMPVPTQNAAVTEQNAPGPQIPTSTEGLTGSAGLNSAKRIARAVQPGVGYTVDTSNREEVRLFYKSVYASTVGVDPGWTGNVSTCNAGDTSAEFKASVQRSVNWFRAMAGVPANVEFDPVLNAKAQQAAMLMSANRQLSHTPPASWICFNAIASEAANKSNLGIGSFGQTAVANGYVLDPGANNYLVGHRRWLLYPQTKLMGTGDIVGSGGTPSTNALWTLDDNFFAARPSVRDDFVAWPPKGFIPYNTVYPRWSISYPKADFSKSRVTMTENGVPIAVRMEVVANVAGENTLVWIPGNYADGMTWAKPNADTEYQVSRPIQIRYTQGYESRIMSLG